MRPLQSSFSFTDSLPEGTPKPVTLAQQLSNEEESQLLSLCLVCQANNVLKSLPSLAVTLGWTLGPHLQKLCVLSGNKNFGYGLALKASFSSLQGRSGDLTSLCPRLHIQFQSWCFVIVDLKAISKPRHRLNVMLSWISAIKARAECSRILAKDFGPWSFMSWLLVEQPSKLCLEHSTTFLVSYIPKQNISQKPSSVFVFCCCNKIPWPKQLKDENKF